MTYLTKNLEHFSNLDRMQAICAEKMCAEKARPLRRSRARFPLLSPAVTSSPGAGEVFPQRGSQAVKFVAEVLSVMRKFPAVLLALPLGELSPQVTERAQAVNLIVKVSGEKRMRFRQCSWLSLWESWQSQRL